MLIRKQKGERIHNSNNYELSIVNFELILWHCLNAKAAAVI